MMTLKDRLNIASHWDREFKKLDDQITQQGPHLLGESDFKKYRLMKEFAHHVGEMLALIADTLTPRDFEEFEKHGFAETARTGQIVRVLHGRPLPHRADPSATPPPAGGPARTTPAR